MTDILQPVLAVLLVLGLLGGALFLLRKRGVVSHGSGQLKLIERIPLGRSMRFIWCAWENGWFW